MLEECPHVSKVELRPGMGSDGKHCDPLYIWLCCSSPGRCSCVARPWLGPTGLTWPTFPIKVLFTLSFSLKALGEKVGTVGTGRSYFSRSHRFLVLGFVASDGGRRSAAGHPHRGPPSLTAQLAQAHCRRAFRALARGAPSNIKRSVRISAVVNCVPVTRHSTNSAIWSCQGSSSRRPCCSRAASRSSLADSHQASPAR